jgi:hypothetical protein
VKERERSEMKDLEFERSAHHGGRHCGRLITGMNGERGNVNSDSVAYKLQIF